MTISTEIIIKNFVNSSSQENTGYILDKICEFIGYSYPAKDINIAVETLNEHEIDFKDCKFKDPNYFLRLIARHSEGVQIIEYLKNLTNFNLDHVFEKEYLNPSNTNLAPLFTAAQHGNEVVAALLIEKEADVNAKDDRDYTPLYWAVENGHRNVAALLIEKGADVNVKDRYGNTLLHTAANKGHTEVVELLLKNNADINAQNNAGNTALHRAAYNGHLEIARLLIEKGADVNAQNDNGDTALHWTAENSHAEVAELLIENKVDVNAQNDNGNTPLHVAIHKKADSNVIKAFIKGDADLEIRNKQNQTPFNYLSDVDQKTYRDYAKYISNKKRIKPLAVIGLGLVGASAGFGMMRFVPQLNKFITDNLSKLFNRNINNIFGKFAIAGVAVFGAAGAVMLGIAGHKKYQSHQYTKLENERKKQNGSPSFE